MGAVSVMPPALTMKAAFVRLVTRQIDELRNLGFRPYCWAVWCAHATVLLFHLTTPRLHVLRSTYEPICWPIFEDCWMYRITADWQLPAILGFHALLLIASASVLAGGYTVAYWWVILVQNVFLAGLIAFDFRLGANEFYFLFWLNGVFLFWPHKRTAMVVLIGAVYFWSGSIKLNWEWLSGAVLSGPLWGVPERLVPWACAYVVVLEMVMVWFVLARSRPIALLALAQLVLFHVQSLTQIHWFFPVLMTTVLAILTFNILADHSRHVSLATLVAGRAPRAVYVLLAFFSAMQLLPHLYRGDPALTGQGRLFSVYMFQAQQVCDVTGTVFYDDREPEAFDLQIRDLETRVRCDPIVYYSRARNLCRSGAARPQFRDLALRMTVRRTTERHFRTVIDEPRFCSEVTSYSLFRNNPWLK